MKLLKFFALSTVAISLVISNWVLWTFAAYGANTAFVDNPPVGMMGNIGMSLMTALIHMCAMYPLYMIGFLWWIGTFAIFESEIQFIYNWMRKFKVVRKQEILYEQTTRYENRSCTEDE